MADVAAGRQELEQRVIQKAQEDSAFRSSLLADPKAAIEQEMGASLPSGLRVKAVEESSDTIYVVVPQASSGDSSGKLSDSELEAVAGGWGTGGNTTQASCNYGC